MITKALLLFPSALLFAACGEGKPTPDHPAGSHVHADGTVHHDDDHGDAHGDGHAHGERTTLGAVTLGEHSMQVFQLGKVEPGKEADFDLDFAAGKALPPAVRGWIGDESGRGSLRVRFEKESATRLHGRPEAPAPLADGSALWLEIDGAAGPVKKSIGFRR